MVKYVLKINDVKYFENGGSKFQTRNMLWLIDIELVTSSRLQL